MTAINLPGLRGLVLLTFLSILAATPTQADVSQSEQELVLGVFPYLPPRELEKVYAPIAVLFSEALGKKVLFRSSSSYRKFMSKLDQQAFDIVMVQPFDYVHIADQFGYVPIAARDEALSTVVVVPRDSALANLESLKGKKVALPPSVAAVSLLLKAALKDKGLKVDDVQISHHRSHISCMQQVVIGAVDACGTAAPALRFFTDNMGVELKIIAETRKIPHTLFAAHPKITPAEREKILQILQALAATEEGRRLLQRGKLKPFKPVTDAHYDEVRDFQKYVNE
ncbi:phosphate/phosphite/phosphonate ABC transporter substrate-binding protein [Kaarinaea lacus]